MKKIVALILMLCLLPAAVVADGLTVLGLSDFVYMPDIQDGATIYYANGDLDLDQLKYDDYEQYCYRPIRYITHYSDGSTETTMVPEAMVKITYRYYYGIDKQGRYVMAGGNPVPTLTPIAPAQFAVSATHVANTSCNAVQLPNYAGYTYTFSGGYFTMDYYDVIHLDEDGNVIRKELNIGQTIAYSCTFTYP